jgi:hypothetical protein
MRARLPDVYQWRSWFAWYPVAVKSPFTVSGWEYGDSYVKDVKSGNTRTYVDPTIEAK